MKRNKKRKKREKYLSRKQHRIRKEQLRIATREKARQNNRKRFQFKKREDPLSKYYSLRSDCTKKLYKRVKYNQPRMVVDIAGEFGLEHDIAHFLERASSFMSLQSKSLFFDLRECEKIWPSAITLLCSFAQWIEITSNIYKRPKIASSSSNHDKVTSYLNHCGFHDYVSREKDVVPDYYSKGEIVKIRRECESSNLEPREVEIVELVKKRSQFSKDQIEEFDDVVLTEIFNNVSEHGINNKDKGWWTLSQYHKTEGIISVCIADNGIGFKNNLLSGPQREDILRHEPESDNNDGNLLKLAIEENVSGAMNASQKSGLFIESYERGSRRGNGLKRISVTCKKLGVPIAILSHKGYIVIDGNGVITDVGTKTNKVFAGTLYHLKIPAEREKGGR